MKDFVEQASEVLSIRLDLERLLLVGNAQYKRSLFLYAKDSAIPNFVARIPGHINSERRCRTEQENLRAFTHYSLGGLCAPVALAEMPYQEFTCFFQSVVVSEQWQSRIPNRGPKPRRRDFMEATRYLVELYQHTSRASASDVPQCFQHGDFWMGNLGQAGTRLVLYDFEYASTTGTPLHDLFHFCLYYRVALRNRGLVGMEVVEGRYKRDGDRRAFSVTIEDIHEVFITRGPFRNLVQDCIKRYCSACMIPSNIAAQYLQEFVEHSIENYRGIQGLPRGWENAVCGNQ